jgi:hypothetical protein
VHLHNDSVTRPLLPRYEILLYTGDLPNTVKQSALGAEKSVLPFRMLAILLLASNALSCKMLGVSVLACESYQYQLLYF